jgi:HEAT repeat protein
MRTNMNKPNAETMERIAKVRALGASHSSDEHVERIRALGETRDPAAIPALAELLDSGGPIASAVVDALVELGEAAWAPMWRCVDEGVEEWAIRNAYRVLARLGSEYALRAQDAECWADFEEEAARQGWRADREWARRGNLEAEAPANGAV